MTAIVTGANGFIGSALVRELLGRGVSVIALEMPGCTSNLPEGAKNFRVVQGNDIRLIGSALCAATGEVVVYHLGWIGKAGPLRADWRIQLGNVSSALEYYDLAKRLGVSKFICAGTIGEKMLTLPSCEKLKSQNAIYVSSKCYLHRLLDIMNDGRCRVIWATLGNVYGRGLAGGSVLDYALQKILNDEDAVFGPGDQPYDFVNVQDVIRGLAEIGLSPRVISDEFYIGHGTPRLLKEWLYDLGRIAGKENRIKIGGRPDDGTRFLAEWFSIETIRRETDYRPQVSFADGIRENIGYLRGK